MHPHAAACCPGMPCELIFPPRGREQPHAAVPRHAPFALVPRSQPAPVSMHGGHSERRPTGQRAFISYMMARGRFPRNLCTQRASLDPTALTDPLLDPLPGLSSRSPRCSSSRTRPCCWRPSRASRRLLRPAQQARQAPLPCAHTSASARCTLPRQPCVPMHPRPRFTDPVASPCPCWCSVSTTP